MWGKTRAPRKLSNRSTREVTRYAQIWTMDHVYMKNWFKCLGVGGFTDFLSVKDKATDTKYVVPVDSKDADETFDALNNLRGDDTVERLYCDGWKSFKKAVKRL